MARDADLTRQRIMDAARDGFSEKGLAGARVESIARRAGISVRMLYVHFRNKDGLYDAVLRRSRDAGGSDPSSDTRMTLSAVLAPTSFPSVLGHIVRTVTGLRPDDPAFVERYETFLRDLAVRLVPAPQG